MRIYKNYSTINFLLFIVLSTLLLQDTVLAQVIVKKENNSTVMLWIEAEAGRITSPMAVHEGQNASGGQYMEVVSGNNNTRNAPVDGHATYKFTVKNDGTYKVWGRVIASMSDEDAFWVKMDRGNWIEWNDIELGCDWHWDEVHDNQKNNQVMKYYLERGSHTLTFAYCLDQTRVDKLLITNDPDYIPTDIGPRANALFTYVSNTPIVLENVRFNGAASFSTEGTIVSYDWDFGDGNTSPGVTTGHTYSTAGEYLVKLIVTDDTGLTSRLTKKVKVYTGEPVADFIYTPDHSKLDEIVTFDASSSLDANGKIVNYAWDFGDGATGRGVISKHPYAAAGEYSVTLAVTDNESNTVSESQKLTVINPVPKKIIYETDMCLDVDDVGGLAILHAMANNGEVQLLAVCFNEVHPGGAAAIDAVNTWYGRGNIPIGIYKASLPNPDYSEYLDALGKFPHDLDSKSAPSALTVYRQVLGQQPDSSVTIISVGFLNNLNDLLIAERNLVARKVKELVIMAGVNNDGFNLVLHNLVSASENVFKHWPSPIVISHAGGSILTGKCLNKADEKNPVREAFYKFFNSQFCYRPSWDEMTVLYGVRGLPSYFQEITNGTGSLPNGYVWQMKPGYRSFLEPLLPAHSYARIIQDLMLELPVK